MANLNRQGHGSVLENETLCNPRHPLSTFYSNLLSSADRPSDIASPHPLLNPPSCIVIEQISSPDNDKFPALISSTRGPTISSTRRGFRRGFLLPPLLLPSLPLLDILHLPQHFRSVQTGEIQ